MEIEIKNCPFCGRRGYSRLTSSGSRGNGEFFAQYECGCDTCNISFKDETVFTLLKGEPVFKKDGYKKAIEAWNRRVEE